METPHTCTRCGGANLEPGTLGSFSLTFRPSNTNFLTLKTNDVTIKTNMCLDCGLIEFIGDLRKAQSLAGQREKPH